jgi:hypothetical protein
MVSTLATAASNIVLPYITMLVPIFIGLVVIVRLYFQRPFEYRFLPILVSFPAPVLWSLRDFQLADDFYVFLPYAAIGFGSFLLATIRRTDSPRVLAAVLSAILLTIALANTWDEVSAAPAQKLTGTTTNLPAQREGAQQIQERFGEDVKVAQQSWYSSIRRTPTPTSGSPRAWITASTPARRGDSKAGSRIWGSTIPTS